MLYIPTVEIHGGDDEMQERAAHDGGWTSWDALMDEVGKELTDKADNFVPGAKQYNVDYTYGSAGRGNILMKLNGKWVIKNLPLWKGPAGRYVTSDYPNAIKRLINCFLNLFRNKNIVSAS